MASIVLDITSKTVSADYTDKIYVEVTSTDVEDISFSTNVTWIVQCEYNEDNGEFECKVEENTDTLNSRTGIVTIYGYDTDGNMVNAYFTITQSAAELYILSFAKTMEIFDSNAHTDRLTISRSNNIVTVDITKPDWVEVTYPAEDDDDTLMDISMEANTSSDSRNGYIILDGYNINNELKATTQFYISQDYAEREGDLFFTTTGIFLLNIDGDGTAEFEYSSIDTTTLSVSCDSDWVSDVTLDVANKKVTYHYIATEHEDIRTAILTITATDTGGATISAEYYVNQYATPETLEFPIWKDTDVTITTDAAYVDYKISLYNEDIYSGRATVPSSGTASIRVNDILQDYLPSTIDLTGNADELMQHTSNYISAIMYISDGNGNWEPYRALRTFNDYTYEEQTTHYLTSPIMNKVDKRQYFLFSFIDRFDSTPFTTNITTGIHIPGRPAMIQRKAYTMSNEIRTYVRKMTTVTSVNIDNTYQYVTETTCYPYCVYYLNKMGGYSWCLFNRATKQTDSFTYSKYTKDANNTTLDFGQTIYQNDIVTKWALKSDRFNDEQCEKMTELFGSPQVWLHDLEKDKIYPVIVTDTSVDHNTFVNSSMHRSRFTFTVQASQSRMRR